MPNLLHVEAVSLRSKLLNGRTRPIICGCFDLHDPDATEEQEFVVKPYSRVTEGAAGLMKELIASLVAQRLSLNVPCPAIVQIGIDFARSVASDPESADLSCSLGANFGTEYKSDGYGVLPETSKLTAVTFPIACEIFAFDALLQNPDRMYENNKPNFLVKGEEFVVIDHELAFSFLLDIFGDSSPWTLHKCSFLVSHVFFKRLHRKSLELDRLSGALEGLDDDFWNLTREQMPEEWMTLENVEKFEKIRTHCNSILEHKADFISNIRSFLQ
jgi:hypothetical protein